MPLYAGLLCHNVGILHEHSMSLPLLGVLLESCGGSSVAEHSLFGTNKPIRACGGIQSPLQSGDLFLHTTNQENTFLKAPLMLQLVW
jgi:hypothetical protein